MFPVRLLGSSVVLREFREGDLDHVLGVVGDERVTKWLSFDARDRDGAAAMLTGAIQRAQDTPRQEYYLAVALPDRDELIGFGRLAFNGVQAAKLGYAISFDQWGHGYATDTVRTLLDFGFGQLQLHRISAAIGPDNTASITVVRKVGFIQEGRIRDHVFTNGGWRDSLLFSVLAGEWASRHPVVTPTEAAAYPGMNLPIETGKA